MTRAISTLITAAAVLVALCAPARAGGKRIVVLDIEGAPSRALRDAIAKLIRTEHEVIDGAEYRREARRLGLDPGDSASVARLGSVLDADGVLEGALSRDDSEFALRLRLRAGRDGKTVKRIKVRLPSPRLSSKGRAEIRRRLLGAIVALPEVEPEPGAVEPEPPPAAAPEPADTRIVSLTAVEPPPGPEVEPEPIAVVTATRADTTPARDIGMMLHVGASVVVRDLSFITVPGFADTPQGYDGPVAPGIYASGEIFPFVFVRKPGSLLGKLGFGFEVDRVLGLQTAIEQGGAATIVPTTQMRYSINLRVRHMLRGKSSWPTLTLHAGLGHLSFELDDASVPAGVTLDVPNTVYRFFDPGLHLRVPLVWGVALTGAGRFLLITAAGDVQQREQYGAATLAGVTAEAGLEVAATTRIVVRAAGVFTRIDYEFNGTGEQTNNRDGDAATQEVTGATDRYLNGVISLGYVF